MVRVAIWLPSLVGTGVFLLSGLLAGCLDTGPPNVPGDDDLPAPSRWLEFVPAIQMPFTGTGNGGSEPSVASDGSSVYVVANRKSSTSYPDSSWLWTSRDGGRTFRDVAFLDGARVTNAPAAFEPHVDINPDGIGYFVDLTLESITVARTTDRGATWSLRTPHANLVAGGDREWVAAGPGDKVYVTWNQIPTGQWVMASDDGGLTFPMQTLLPGTDAAGEFRGEPGFTYVGVPVVAPDGTLYLARSELGDPWLYTSRDGARTFERTRAWDAGGPTGWLFTTPAVDEAGTVYVSTVEALGGVTRVRYAYSTDGGATFSNPREVVSMPGTHAMQWGAAGPAGTFAVAFYENPDARSVPDDATGDWYVAAAYATNADTPEASFAYARVAPEVVHQGTVCTTGLIPPCPGSSRALGDYLGVEVDPEGAVHVAYANDAGGARTIWYARTPFAVDA